MSGAFYLNRTDSKNLTSQFYAYQETKQMRYIQLYIAFQSPTITLDFLFHLDKFLLTGHIAGICHGYSVKLDSCVKYISSYFGIDTDFSDGFF